MRSPFSFTPGAHPRACGENLKRLYTRSEIAGSSPRMRGKHQWRWGESTPSRLIPAHAGKTERASPANHPPPAHPRACGENLAASLRRSLIIGSSPRMRGKLNHLPHLNSLTRLIPAHAGKTKIWLDSGRCSGAHPRACGENLRLAFKPSTTLGSSPRMRGKLHPNDPTWRRSGLIPAHAGKTLNDLEF